MRLKLLASVALALVAFAPSAHARKFDFKSERFATYFGGSYGPSRVAGTPYSKASGSDVTIDKEIATNASGEFGVAISFQRMTVRVGAEYLMPRHLTDIRGYDSSGTELFLLDSSLTAFIPMVNFELHLYDQPTSRFFVAGGAGYAVASLDNKYTMSDAGTSRFNVPDYSEQGSARAQILQAYAGYEFVFTDTVTLAFGAGYRWGLLTGFKSESDVTTIRGDVKIGDELKNMDGGVRKADIGGGFASMNMRFYFF